MLNILPNTVPFAIAIVLPLGVAGQHIGLGVATAACLGLIYLDRAASLKKALSSKLWKQFLLLWLVLMTPIVASTVAHGRTKDAVSFFWGYVFAGFMPLMGIVLSSMKLNTAAVKRFFAGVLLFCGLIAVSQIVWGWKFDSSTIAESIHRAQGFYSHPLTFAYVLLIVMPWALFQFFCDFKRPLYWMSAVAVLAMIYASQSVTVLALTGLCLLFGVIKLTPAKARTVMLALGVLLGGGVLGTKNQVSEKIETVLSGQRGDRETPYGDDRFAFWHAHWEMFKDAPITGHGTGLEKEDRAPYYERIGLGSVKRMYEAHNMYLQYAVEGGVVPALTLMVFLLWLAKIGWSLRVFPEWERWVYIVTPVVFALGGLTQNAIQDSEVRFALLAYVGYLFWRIHSGNAKATHPTSKLQ